MTGGNPETLHAYIGAFVDELARSGLRHVCIAPGSRSAPLALMLAKHASIRTWMHLDERSAAFFALGMARALREPIGLLCTSGTAAANFLPAIVEARAAGVPLVVLTADRPPELRDVGAPQTIDQNRLYGTYPKWFVEVAIADQSFELLRYARTTACRAIAVAAASPVGPVHLNLPFREPLVPVHPAPPAAMCTADSLAWFGRPNGAPWVVVSEPILAAPGETVQRLATILSSAQRPLIVCGPQFDSGLAAPLARLAMMLRAPLLADPLSQLRWGPHEREQVVDGYDAVLRDVARDESLANRLAFDVILRLGAIPTSKPLLQFMQRNVGAVQVVVDSTGWPDPTLGAVEIIHAEPCVLCDQLVAHMADAQNAPVLRGDPGAEWLACWRRIDDLARSALDSYTSALVEPFEGAAVATVVSQLPSRATLFVSSSMPVRDLDAFAAGDGRTIRVLANRGANGIDGVVSTALGVAAARDATDGPVVLVIGDIAFYHDMNGLLAARLHAIDATIVVLNNDGGGIFSFLPQSDDQAHFEQLFGTPHGLRFEHAGHLYGARYQAADSTRSLKDALAASIGHAGLDIIEMRTDRTRNVALHREAWARVSEALTSEGATIGRARG